MSETFGVYVNDKLVHRVRTHSAALRWLRANLDGTGVIAKEITTQDAGITAKTTTRVEHEAIYVDGKLLEVHHVPSGIRSYAGG